MAFSIALPLTHPFFWPMFREFYRIYSWLRTSTDTSPVSSWCGPQQRYVELAQQCSSFCKQSLPCRYVLRTGMILLSILVFLAHLFCSIFPPTPLLPCICWLLPDQWWKDAATVGLGSLMWSIIEKYRLRICDVKRNTGCVLVHTVFSFLDCGVTPSLSLRQADAVSKEWQVLAYSCMSIYVCVCVCVCVYIYIYSYTYTRYHIYTCLHTHIPAPPGSCHRYDHTTVTWHPLFRAIPWDSDTNQLLLPIPHRRKNRI